MILIYIYKAAAAAVAEVAVWQLVTMKTNELYEY